MICPYCNKEALWCENKIIYGKNYGNSYMCWYCKDCDAYVGCHNNTKEPLGVMADKELRILRIKCHDKFDDIWKNGTVTRKQAYKELQEIMEINQDEAHIGKFDKEQCRKFLTLPK
jgi:hypothetical protein